MKKVYFEKLTCPSIEKPFSIVMKDKPEGELFADMVKKLFPARGKFLGEKKELIVDLDPNVPFGPGPGAQLDFFFKEQGGDLSSVILNMKKIFGGLEFIIHGLDRDNVFAGEGVRFVNKLSSIMAYKVVDVAHFRKIYQVICSDKYEDGIQVSVFLDAGNIFAIYVPRDKTLGEVLASIPLVKAFMMDNPDRLPFNPLTGRCFQLDDLLDMPEMAMVAFQGVSLRAGGNFLMPFPIYNHIVAMKDKPAVQSGAVPCTNCLACNDYCPSGLMPSFLYHNLLNEEEDEAEKLNIAGCVGCGICSFVCPSDLPLYEKIGGYLKKSKELPV